MNQMRIDAIEAADDALQLVGPSLVAVGAEGELALGLLNRLVVEPHAWGSSVTMLVAMAKDAPAAFVMRTGTHPALIVGFAHEHDIDYLALAHAFLRVGTAPTSVNGAVRCSVPFASAWERGAGMTTRTLRDLRAFELRRLRPPRPVVGAARVATSVDLPTLARWGVAFSEDIGEPMDQADAQTAIERLVAAGDLVVWETGGAPASMAAVNRRTSSSSCVAWVYTPSSLRGNGYASAVVAALSQRELDAGAEWCSLFTDLANPTSNHIYAQLGYEPRCDYRHIELVPPSA